MSVCPSLRLSVTRLSSVRRPQRCVECRGRDPLCVRMQDKDHNELRDDRTGRAASSCRGMYEDVFACHTLIAEVRVFFVFTCLLLRTRVSRKYYFFTCKLCTTIFALLKYSILRVQKVPDSVQHGCYGRRVGYKQGDHYYCLL